MEGSWKINTDKEWSPWY